MTDLVAIENSSAETKRAIRNLNTEYIWPYYPPSNQKYWSAIHGVVDPTVQVTLNGVTWQFLPFIFPEKGGVIDSLVLGQQGGGAGAIIDIGYGIWEPAISSSDTISALGNIITSGEIATTDDQTNNLTIFSGASHIVPDRYCLIGFGTDSAQVMTFDSCLISANLPGWTGTTTKPVAAATLINIGKTPPPLGSNLSGASSQPITAYCTWTPPGG